MVQSNNFLNAISKRLIRHRLFYVCRDIERATGLDLSFKNYFIITNESKYSKLLSKRYSNIILIRATSQLDTRELLELKKTKSLIKKGDFVVVFKNTPQIEKICKNHNWNLLNPKAEISSRVEEKISQITWLGPLSKYLPKHKIDICKNINWRWKNFIIQFNHSHTGSGTILVDSKEKLEEIKNKFPMREARVVEYIKGPLFTNNNVVWGDKIMVGNINYQITGLSPFTDNHFATIGNDWALPHKILSKEQIKEYKKIVLAVGKRLKKDGWKGLFGVDIIVDENTKKLYLIEINARQPASTTFESILQAQSKTKSKLITTFQAHLGSLFELEPNGYELIDINDGAQIIQRVTQRIDRIRMPKIESGEVTNAIMYENTNLGSDLVRIQSKKGIMDNHNIFNEVGQTILVAVMSAHRSTIWNSARAGIILTKDNKILLIKRNKYGDEYYSLVGGTVEEGEDFKTTAIREAMEETNLTFTIDDKKDPLHFHTHRDEYYYFAKNLEGTEYLGGPEKIRNNPNNSYQLEWVEINKLQKIRLMPKLLKDGLIEALKK